jgi:hypothetical protein
VLPFIREIRVIRGHVFRVFDSAVSVPSAVKIFRSRSVPVFVAFVNFCKKFLPFSCSISVFCFPFSDLTPIRHSQLTIRQLILMDATPPTSTQTQTWAAIGTAIAGALAVALKKRFSRRDRNPAPKKPEVTATDFQHALDTLRDSLNSNFTALVAKLEANQKDMVNLVAHYGSITEQRLDNLESAVARLDERTKNS